MPDVASLQVVVGADTSAAERGLADLGTKVGGVGSAIQSALGAAAVGAVAGLGAAFVGSVKTAADFEKQMSAVGAVAGASAQEMQQLTKLALDLGKETSFSASEAAAGLEELIKAGVSMQDAIGGGAKAALDLAAAGGVAVAEAAEIASNAMNVFNLKGSDMAHVADVIAGAANASAIGVNDFKFSLAASGAVAATVGISFESLSEAIAVMGQAGIKGSDAGTSLKTMMMNLIPSTKKQNELFRELGIITAEGGNAFFDAEGKAKSFAEIGQVLQDALRGMTKEQQLAALETMFGSDAIRAATVMAEAGAAGFNEMAEAMGKVTAAQVAAARLDNLWGSVEKLKGSLETAAIMLGSLFLPALKGLVDGLTDFVNQGIEIIEQLPDAWRTIGEAFAGAWEPSETLTPFMNAVGLLGITFRQMYDAVYPLIVELGAIFQKVMVGDIGGALDQFFALLGTVAGQLAPILAGWGQAFIDWIGPMIPPFLAAVADIATQLFAWIADQIPPLLQQLAAWGQQFIAWVAPMIPPLLAALGAMAAQLLAWIATQVPPIVAALVAWGAEFIAWVGPQIGPMLSELGKLILAALDWIIAQVPGITAKLVEWGLLFATWVALVAIPELIKALPGIFDTIVDWIASAALEIVPRVWALGEALVTGIYEGFVNAWATIGPKIREAIGSAFSFGGGSGSGLTSMSWRGAGSANPNASQAEVEQYAYQAALARGWSEKDARELVSLINGEGAGQGARAVGDSGRSFGPMQLFTGGGLGNRAQEAGINVRDPSTWQQQILFGMETIEREGAGQWTVARNRGLLQRPPVKVAVPNTSLSPGALGSITMTQAQWGTNLAGMTAEEAAAACGPYAAYLFAQATGRNPNPREAEELARLSGWTEAGMGGTGNFMNLLGRMGVRAVRDSTPTEQEAINAGSLVGFSTPKHYFVSQGFDPTTGKFNVGATGTYGGGSAWMSYEEIARIGGGIQDIIALAGQMGPAFSAAEAVTGAAFKEMGTVVTEQGALMVSSSTDAMGNVTRIYSDGTGVVGATITNAAGQIVQSWGQIAEQSVAQAAIATTGVQQNYDLMGTAVVNSVTQMGDGIQTTLMDAAGNTVTTITAANGEILNQYAQLANGASFSIQDMAVKSTTSVDEMTGHITRTVTDMAGNVIVTTTDMNGQIVAQTVTTAASMTQAWTQTSASVVATATEMGLQVMGQSRVMGEYIVTTTKDATGKMVNLVTDAAGKVIGAFGDIVEEGKQLATGLDIAGEAFDRLVKDMKNAQKQAEKTADGIRDAWDAAVEFTGIKGGEGKNTKKAAARASGGWVGMGETFLVGERGPELFVPSTNGYVVPNHALGSSGDAIDYERLARLISASRPIVLQGTSEELLSQVRREQRREAALYSARGPR